MHIRESVTICACAAVLAGASATGGATTAAAAQVTCNPNTGCLPRPADVFEAGTEPGYYVRPATLDIVQNHSEHIYVTGLHWSTWTGGYGVHGLIRGTARGTGTVHATGTGARIATIYLWDVTNGGTNAFTYYGQLSIHGDRAVSARWHWSMLAAKWET